jgi:hypothetical protein
LIRRLLFLAFMMGAIGVPYLLTSSAGWLSSVKSRFMSDSKSPSTADSGNDTTLTALGNPSGVAAASFAGKPQKIDTPPQDLAEVLHFNGTPAWVMTRWPRVTSGLAQLDLQGYRVPLVTGTGESDVAGSLTYYFDREQRVKFITFRGTTGDPRKLIGLVTQHYNLEQQPSDDPGLYLYQVRKYGKPLSELRIRPARVVRADQPFARYEVELALMRP